MPVTNGENWLRVTRGCEKDAQGWHCCAGLTFQEAEGLLDWLESHGVARREVRVGEGGAVVRWHTEEAA